MSRGWKAVLGACVAFMTAAAAVAADPPVSETPETPALKAEPRLLWEARLPEAAFGGVAVGEGLVFVILVDGRLCAYDLEAGKQKWSRDLKEDPRTGPAFAAGRVAFVDASRTLRAVKASDGKDAWHSLLEVQASSEIGASGDLFCLGVGNMACAAFSASDGKPAWRVETMGDVIGAPWVESRRVLIGTTGHKLYSVARQTGELLAEATLDGELIGGPGAESEAARDSLVCVGLHNMILEARSASMKQAWQTSVHGMVRTSPLVNPSVVYAGTDQGMLYAFHRGSGGMLWRHGVGGPLVDRMIMLPGALVVGAGPALHFLDPSDGHPRQEFVLGGRIQGLAEMDGIVVAVTSERKLVAAGIRVAPVEPEPEPPLLASVVADPPRVNPSRGTTSMLTFTLVRRAPLTVDVADASGRRMRLVTHREMAEAGTYRFRWNGTDEKGKILGPGVYRMRIVAGEERVSVGVELAGRR